FNATLPTPLYSLSLHDALPIFGSLSAKRTGEFLTDKVAQFCREIFADGGAIMAGAAGGRFVYDMRRRFELYYKLNPLRSYPELRDRKSTRLNSSHVSISYAVFC